MWPPRRSGQGTGSVAVEGAVPKGSPSSRLRSQSRACSAIATDFRMPPIVTRMGGELTAVGRNMAGLKDGRSPLVRPGEGGTS